MAINACKISLNNISTYYSSPTMLVWSESECCDFSIKLLWNTHEVMHQEVVSLIRIKGSCSHQLNHLGFQPSSTYLTWSTPCSSWTVHFHRSFVGQWIFSTGFFLGLAKPVGFLGSVWVFGFQFQQKTRSSLEEVWDWPDVDMQLFEIYYGLFVIYLNGTPCAIFCSCFQLESS